MKIDDVWEDDEDDYAALDKITERNKQLASVSRVKVNDNKAKVRFLAKAVAGKQWVLHVQQRNPVDPSFQRLTNELYKSKLDIGTYQQASIDHDKIITGEVWKYTASTH